MQQMLRNHRRRDLPQIKPLTPAQNRRQDLVRLGRRKDELHMRRRLLQRLQQRVEGIRRQHVHLVNVVDPELPTRRSIVHPLPQRPDVIHTVVRRPVNLRHIKAPSFRNLHTHILVRIKIHPRPTSAVQRLRKNPARARLPRPTRPDKQIRMRQSVLRDRISQRPNHMILPENVLKRLRSVLSRENLV